MVSDPQTCHTTTEHREARVAHSLVIRQRCGRADAALEKLARIMGPLRSASRGEQRRYCPTKIYLPWHWSKWSCLYTAQANGLLPSIPHKRHDQRPSWHLPLLCDCAGINPGIAAE